MYPDTHWRAIQSKTYHALAQAEKLAETIEAGDTVKPAEAARLHRLWLDTFIAAAARSGITDRTSAVALFNECCQYKNHFPQLELTDEKRDKYTLSNRLRAFAEAAEERADRMSIDDLLCLQRLYRPIERLWRLHNPDIENVAWTEVREP